MAQRKEYIHTHVFVSAITQRAENDSALADLCQANQHPRTVHFFVHHILLHPCLSRPTRGSIRSVCLLLCVSSHLDTPASVNFGRIFHI